MYNIFHFLTFLPPISQPFTPSFLSYFLTHPFHLSFSLIDTAQHNITNATPGGVGSSKGQVHCLGVPLSITQQNRFKSHPTCSLLSEVSQVPESRDAFQWVHRWELGATGGWVPLPPMSLLARVVVTAVSTSDCQHCSCCHCSLLTLVKICEVPPLSPVLSPAQWLVGNLTAAPFAASSVLPFPATLSPHHAFPCNIFPTPWSQSPDQLTIDFSSVITKKSCSDSWFLSLNTGGWKSTGM